MKAFWSLSIVALSVLGCAAPADPGKPLEITEIADCPTGTRVCRKDGSTSGAVTVSREAAQDAMSVRTSPARPGTGN